MDLALRKGSCFIKEDMSYPSLRRLYWSYYGSIKIPLGDHAGELKTYLRLVANGIGNECEDRLIVMRRNLMCA